MRGSRCDRAKRCCSIRERSSRSNLRSVLQSIQSPWPLVHRLLFLISLFLVLASWSPLLLHQLVVLLLLQLTTRKSLLTLMRNNHPPSRPSSEAILLLVLPPRSYLTTPSLLNKPLLLQETEPRPSTPQNTQEVIANWLRCQNHAFACLGQRFAAAKEPSERASHRIVKDILGCSGQY